MKQRLVYIIGTVKDFAGGVGIGEGNFLMHVPNYTQVYDRPPKTEKQNEFCLALMVAAEEVVERLEGPNAVMRLWTGPQNNRNYPHKRGRALAYSLTSPLDNPAEDPVMREKLAQATQAVDDLLGKMTQAQQIQESQAAEVERLTRALEAAQELVRQQEGEIFALKGKITEATTSTQIRDVNLKTIAEVCLAASDPDLEAMPHIGPAHRIHVRKWAREILEG